MFKFMLWSLIQQVNRITQAIAYPDFIKDDEQLDDFYRNVSP